MKPTKIQFEDFVRLSAYVYCNMDYNLMGKMSVTGLNTEICQYCLKNYDELYAEYIDPETKPTNQLLKEVTKVCEWLHIDPPTDFTYDAYNTFYSEHFTEFADKVVNEIAKYSAYSEMMEGTY